MKICPLPITTCKRKNEAPPPPLPKWTQCYSETTPAPWINEKEGEFPYQLMKMDGIRFLRVSCPSILTALKIEGDRFSIHSTAMTEDSFSVMLIITLICLFTRYGVVKIRSLSSHNNAASFTKGLNNLGADEGSTFCDLVIRYHLVKKLSSDENVRNEKKVPNQLESTKIRRKCPKSDESVPKQTRASEIGRKLSKTDRKNRNRKEAYTCKTVRIISNESFRNRIFCCVKSERYVSLIHISHLSMLLLFSVQPSLWILGRFFDQFYREEIIFVSISFLILKCLNCNQLPASLCAS